jgi:hypothetical protein
LRWTWTFFAVVALLLGTCFRIACPRAFAEASRERRVVTVRDMIEMTQWSDLAYFLGGPPSTQVGLFSPDGNQFVVLLRKGNLALNTNEFSLLLFRTNEAFQSPRPVVAVKMSSSSYRPGIKNARWLGDNETIVFLGENAGELPAVYSVNVKTRLVKKLTQQPTAIVAYDTSRDGRVLVYEADPPQPGTDRRSIEKDGIVVSTQSPYEILSAGCNAYQKPEEADKQLFVKIGDQAAAQIVSPDFLTEYLPLSLEPAGKFAVLAVYLKTIPAAWKEYEDEGLHPYIVERQKPGVRSNVQQYMLLDVDSKQLTPLVDAPIPWRNTGQVWAPGGESIAISGLFAPLDNQTIADRSVRKSVPMVLEVDVRTKGLAEISRKPLRVQSWEQESGVLTLVSKEGQTGETATYRKERSAWVKISDTGENRKSEAKPIQVRLKENMNAPPHVVVSDSVTGKETLLLDLNPQFAFLNLTSEEEIHWNSSDGHEARGGLYLPASFVKGRRYPLVIQTHGFNPNRFWMDGPWSGAFAAQALASKGFVVVQADETLTSEEYTKYWRTPEEGPHEMYAFEGLVDYLDRRGLVDRTRVGIIGFSRTVYHVAYTLTHSNYRFGAAVLADGFDASYFSYLVYPNEESSALNGGRPTGQGLQSWFKNSPSFNLDKIRTPIRIEGYGPASLLAQWGWLTGLSTLGKPVELVNLPFATHLLVKPWERFLSEQGTVDWFSFWLLNKKDGDPSKRDQYRRWEELKSQDAISAK